MPLLVVDCVINVVIGYACSVSCANCDISIPGLLGMLYINRARAAPCGAPASIGFQSVTR
jgi:hypothetical protein